MKWFPALMLSFAFALAACGNSEPELVGDTSPPRAEEEIEADTTTTPPRPEGTETDENEGSEPDATTTTTTSIVEGENENETDNLDAEPEDSLNDVQAGVESSIQVTDCVWIAEGNFWEATGTFDTSDDNIAVLISLQLAGNGETSVGAFNEPLTDITVGTNAFTATNSDAGWDASVPTTCTIAAVAVIPGEE